MNSPSLHVLIFLSLTTSLRAATSEQPDPKQLEWEAAVTQSWQAQSPANALPAEIRACLALEPSEREPAQREAIAAYFQAHKNDPVAAAVSGDSVIRAPFAGSEIVITTTSRLAGAIHSLTWNDREFIDSVDHGRQLQSASGFDISQTHNSEVFNPTEAGSRHDGAGPSSTSRLLKLKAATNHLSTLTQMAFWLKPGEKSGGDLARNTTALSRHLLAKQVTIGIPGLPNVLDYSIIYTIPANEPHADAQIEALTGYMPAAFERFWHLNPKTNKLEPLSDGPGEQPDPVALSTADGAFAMGIFAPKSTDGRSRGPGYGRFRFVRERVVKWNCVFRIHSPAKVNSPDEWRYRMFVPIGTLADVESALATLTSHEER